MKAVSTGMDRERNGNAMICPVSHINKLRLECTLSVKALFPLFLTLAFFFTSAATCFGWEWQNPKPTGAAIRGVYFFDSSYGFVVGNSGLILNTTNSFSTWTFMNSGTTNDLYSIFFTDSVNGCAVGAAGTILKTTDGGTTWTTKQSGTQYTLNTVYFVDYNTGYIVGNSGIILKTTNAGVSWSRTTSPIVNDLKGVFFLDATNGWVVGYNGSIYKTANGGSTWTYENSTVSDTLTSVQFKTTLIGYVVGMGGRILKTVNGGSTWTLETSNTTNDLYSVMFANETVGYASGVYGTILKTANGGDSWSTLVSNTAEDINALYFTSATAGYAVGTNGVIFKTTGGGSTWTPKTTSVTSNHLKSAYFVNNMFGWIVGAQGTILKTATSGESWGTQISNTTSDLYAVYFADTLTGYAAGSGGVIIKTTNGGMSWNPLDSGTTNDLRSIYFTDSLTGYAVGYSGTILKTADGGDSWNIQSAGLTNTFYSVHCIDALTCVVAGSIGKVIKTINGGALWQVKTVNTTDSLYSIYMVNQTVGYASGYLGAIVKTIDGGNTWNLQGTGTTKDLFAIHFYDTLNGFALGESGIILKTTNGGTTWTTQNSWTSSFLRTVNYANYNTTFAAGDNGDVIVNIGPVDSSPPAVTDNQNGDDVWRKTNNGTYNVDFSDAGGSHMEKFQICACATNAACSDIIGWTNVASAIKSDSYTNDWGLPTAVWDALPDGVSYISVHAYDYAGLDTQTGPLFYVRKDTTPPTAPLVVNDGLGADADFATSTGALSANWSGASDPHSGIPHYWYGIGTTAGATDVLNLSDAGADTFVTRSGLTLTNGTMYYFTVLAENGSGFRSSAVNSNGQTYDGTPPTSPAPVNDGAGLDIDFSTDTANLSANWSDSSDPETGLAHYWYAIGTSAGATDVVAWTDAVLNTSVAKLGLTLVEGVKYIFSVKAENTAGGQTPVVSSDGIVIDNSPPDAPAAVNDGTGVYMAFASSTASLSANWSPVADPHSGIAKYLYAIGTIAGGNDILDWADAGSATAVTRTGLTLNDGQEYFFSVKAMNNVGMVSPAKNSNGQTLDATPPSAIVTVNDGIEADIVYATSATQLSANWTFASDPQSGVSRYWYAIGTATATADVTGWVNNGLSESVTHSGLSLTGGQKYFFTVKAENGGGGLSAPASSNGQTVDVTPPATIASVNDGPGADLTYASSSTQLSANWPAASDPESGMARYWYAIGTTAGGVDVAPWTDNSVDRNATRTGLTLTSGQKYYFSVKSENNAGLVSTANNSNGQTVDTTPPATIAVVYDGTGSDIEYSTSSERLSANWSASADPLSGIARYWYAIGTATGVVDIAGWTDNGLNTSVTRAGLSLTDGHKYYFSVKAENGSGLKAAAAYSNGATVDATPPGSVTGMTATPGNQQIVLSWTNPTDSDFVGVKIVRKTTGYPGNPDDGILRYEGNMHTFTDTGVDNSATYFYAAFAYDRVHWYSTAGAGARITSTPFGQAPNVVAGWNLIASSGTGGSINTQSVFGTHDYEIVGFNGLFNNLTSTGTVAFDIGKAYWVYSAVNIGQMPTNATVFTGTTYSIVLRPGWNLFSIPFNTAIPFYGTNVSLSCDGVPPLPFDAYFYKTGDGYKSIWQDANANLIPWTGYWINIGNRQCTLNLTK
jgi:photosystem II stability/assembly factor-like uncharacterized protein